MGNIIKTGSYQFGISDQSAPAINGFNARTAELRFEPEVYVQAQDGEGHTESIARSRSKVTGTFTGYVTDLAALKAVTSFLFESRRFIVRSLGVPRQKGQFVEVSLEAESYAGVTAEPV